MPLFSLTQSLFGFSHGWEDDHWVRKRNGQTLHLGDLYHPNTYGTKARVARMRPWHMHYEPDDLNFDDFYTPRARRERPTSPAPRILRREPRGHDHGWQEIEEPSCERPNRRSPSPIVLYREPRHVARKSWDEPSYYRPAARSPSPSVLYREPRDVEREAWEEPLNERTDHRDHRYNSPRPRKGSFEEYTHLRVEEDRHVIAHRVRSTRRSSSPRPSTSDVQPARRGRAMTSPSSRFSTTSTLVDRAYEPDTDYHRETRYRALPASPRPEHRRVRFASPTRGPQNSHLDSINPLINTIQANADHRDSRDALARLETLAFKVYPVMHKLNLHVDTLLELDDTLTTIDGWNSGHGKEISIKVRKRHGGWRSMDEMVDSMLEQLAHNMYTERGIEWYELWERLRREFGRLSH